MSGLILTFHFVLQIVDSFPEFASSAMAAKTLLSRIAGGAVPMFVDRWYHSKLGPNWCSCVLALIAVLVSGSFVLSCSTFSIALTSFLLSFADDAHPLRLPPIWTQDQGNVQEVLLIGTWASLSTPKILPSFPS
jgi:hypothetical protein